MRENIQNTNLFITLNDMDGGEVDDVRNFPLKPLVCGMEREFTGVKESGAGYDNKSSISVRRARRQRMIDKIASPGRSPVPVRSKYFGSDPAFSEIEKPSIDGTIGGGNVAQTPTKESLMSLLFCPDSLDELMARTGSLKTQSADAITTPRTEEFHLACQSSDAVLSGKYGDAKARGITLTPLVPPRPRRRTRENAYLPQALRSEALGKPTGTLRLAPLTSLACPSSDYSPRAVSPYEQGPSGGAAMLSNAVLNNYFRSNIVQT